MATQSLLMDLTTPNKPAPTAPPEPSHFVRREVFNQYALYGLAGDIVRTLAPHCEAQPEALLLQLLAAFGNVIGAGPHCMVGATRHSLNLFVILVGDSSKARKGTSWDQIASLFAAVDPAWAENRVVTERVTLRGLTSHLGQQQTGDRRLLLLAEEFASLLHTMGRSRSQLSPLLRTAWDTGTLRTLHTGVSAPPSRGHISLIGHITQPELNASLHRNDTHNGFANRCLWGWVQRAQCLPDGGCIPPDAFYVHVHALKRAVEWATSEPEILLRRDHEAGAFWNDYYSTLSREKTAIQGAATGRAEAQVLRLSALYAALDCSPAIRMPHLEAALAVWDYCSLSAGVLFGTCIGDSIADRIHEALEASPGGLTRKKIRTLFHGHISSGAIDQALEKLESIGAVVSESIPGNGRPATLWSAIETYEVMT